MLLLRKHVPTTLCASWGVLGRNSASLDGFELATEHTVLIRFRAAVTLFLINSNKCLIKVDGYPAWMYQLFLIAVLREGEYTAAEIQHAFAIRATECEIFQDSLPTIGL